MKSKIISWNWLILPLLPLFFVCIIGIAAIIWAPTEPDPEPDPCLCIEQNIEELYRRIEELAEIDTARIQRCEAELKEYKDSMTVCQMYEIAKERREKEKTY